MFLIDSIQISNFRKNIGYNFLNKSCMFKVQIIILFRFGDTNFSLKKFFFFLTFREIEFFSIRKYKFESH